MSFIWNEFSTVSFARNLLDCTLAAIIERIIWFNFSISQQLRSYFIFAIITGSEPNDFGGKELETMIMSFGLLLWLTLMSSPGWLESGDG